MNKYIYSEKNRIEEPNTYMYSNFIGLDFLNLYEKNRKNIILIYQNRYQKNKILDYREFLCLQKLVDITKLFLNKNSLISEEKKIDFYLKSILKYETKERLSNINPSNNFDTYENLLKLISNFQFNTPSNKDKNVINFLLKKFEISKKIYPFYDLNNKKSLGDFKYLKNYWLLKIALIIYYLRDNDLQYLNTILKISDTLCSQKKEILLNVFVGDSHSLVIYIELILINYLRSVI